MSHPRARSLQKIVSQEARDLKDAAVPSRWRHFLFFPSRIFFLCSASACLTTTNPPSFVFSGSPTLATTLLLFALQAEGPELQGLLVAVDRRERADCVAPRCAQRPDGHCPVSDCVRPGDHTRHGWCRLVSTSPFFYLCNFFLSLPPLTIQYFNPNKRVVQLFALVVSLGSIGFCTIDYRC